MIRRQLILRTKLALVMCTRYPRMCLGPVWALEVDQRGHLGEVVETHQNLQAGIYETL